MHLVKNTDADGADWNEVRSEVAADLLHGKGTHRFPWRIIPPQPWRGRAENPAIRHRLGAPSRVHPPAEQELPSLNNRQTDPSEDSPSQKEPLQESLRPQTRYEILARGQQEKNFDRIDFWRLPLLKINGRQGRRTQNGGDKRDRPLLAPLRVERTGARPAAPLSALTTLPVWGCPQAGYGKGANKLAR